MYLKQPHQSQQSPMWGRGLDSEACARSGLIFQYLLWGFPQRPKLTQNSQRLLSQQTRFDVTQKKVRKYLGKAGDNGFLFFKGKFYLALPSFWCLHGQILMDNRASILWNLGKKLFLGKQWDQQEKEVKSDPKKAIRSYTESKGKT